MAALGDAGEPDFRRFLYGTGDFTDARLGRAAEKQLGTRRLDRVGKPVTARFTAIDGRDSLAFELGLTLASHGLGHARMAERLPTGALVTIVKK